MYRIRQVTPCRSLLMATTLVLAVAGCANTSTSTNSGPTSAPRNLTTRNRQEPDGHPHRCPAQPGTSPAAARTRYGVDPGRRMFLRVIVARQ